MTDYGRMPRRHYYADFELREACFAVATIAGCAGFLIGMILGWWTA